MPVQFGGGTAAASGSSIASGLLVEFTPQGILYAKKYVGEPNIPQDIKRRRRQVYDLMRRMGAPVLIKHMFNADDVDSGIAKRSDNWDTTYGQTRHEDPLSYGVGYCSVETSDDEWTMPDGTLVRSATKPSGGKPAPKYRGYGPGFLIFMIQPDAAEDLYRVNPTGALIKVQTAQAQAPWYPDINDNDLIINCHIDKAGSILTTDERYQAKMTNPISMRGYGDRNGKREYSEDGGNRYVVNQSFEMTLVPQNDALYRVETDR